MTDLSWAIVVLVTLFSLICLTKVFGSHLNAEWSRKIIHVGMGILSLGFPFMFEHRLTVLYLGLVTLPLLLALRLNSKLRTGVGSVLLGVSRNSFGELYFLVALVVVFLFYQDPYEYIISMSVLTFADSIAALVGISYGRFSLSHGSEDSKSSEGSIMFFIIAYFCTLIPLQLMSDVGRAEVLVISLLIGILAALIEMVSTDGNDNILLPILTFAFLRHNILQPIEEILIIMSIMILILIPCFIIYKLTTITRLSIVYSLLTAYILLIQGGYPWLIPAFMLFLTFGILPSMPKEERQITHNYRVIACNTIVGIVCLILSIFLPAYQSILYLSFSLANASHLNLNTYSRLVNFKQQSPTISVLYSLFKSGIFVVLPTFMISNLGSIAIIIYLLFLLASSYFAIYLTKKFDYRHITDEKLRGHTLSVGILVFVFTIVITQWVN
ncbi:MAG: hypothetical protein FWF57_03930 [Defluviitaleaceae bacterium]|nr:hypothetical protein [Defluviitaleaceae bacterium]